MLSRYPCLMVHPIDDHQVGGGCCANDATYFAIDNRARYGHLCCACWRALSGDERALYVEDTPR